MKAKLLATALLVSAAFAAKANIITFSTPSGATEPGTGLAVNASATFTTSADTVTITLQNLLANPTSVAQALSDISFLLTSGQTSGTLMSSSGTQRTIAANGTFIDGATTSTGWGIDPGTLHLTALGFIGPAGLIIGPAGPGNVYSEANGSIAGNGPHNPFIGLSATFVIDVPGVTVDSSIANMLFSFGTTAGDNVPGVPTQQRVPEPSSLSLFGLALLAIVGLRRLRRA